MPKKNEHTVAYEKAFNAGYRKRLLGEITSDEFKVLLGAIKKAYNQSVEDDKDFKQSMTSQAKLREEMKAADAAKKEAAKKEAAKKATKKEIDELSREIASNALISSRDLLD